LRQELFLGKGSWLIGNPLAQIAIIARTARIRNANGTKLRSPFPKAKLRKM
jgi:hypothetical protein